MDEATARLLLLGVVVWYVAIYPALFELHWRRRRRRSFVRSERL
jgi:hypothetical protein